MKKHINYLLAIIFMVAFTSCSEDKNNDEEISSKRKIDDVGLQVSFNVEKATANPNDDSGMTTETPNNYSVALKSVTLLGVNGTNDVELFNKANLASSLVFDFTDDNTAHSLLDGTEIPDGEYNSIQIEIYYLQMNLAIATTDRGVERRNIRIYLSDDAETEDGAHQPGDLTQINDETEIGWLLGEGQVPNMDPVTPRYAAYTHNGDSTTWYDFAGKSGEEFGPFGDVNFMSSAPHPIYHTEVDFTLVDNGGTNLILDFNVNNCWQFEDKNADGVFGAGDLDPVVPTRWHMELPNMTVTVQ